MPFVRESWFDGETFTSLEHARESALHWCREIAGARVHGTTRKVPRETFESLEKPAMRAAPGALYDVPLYVDRRRSIPTITCRLQTLCTPSRTATFTSTCACAPIGRS